MTFKFSGKLKSCNLYNNTLHIIIFPNDGLRTAVELQSMEPGSEMKFQVKPLYWCDICDKQIHSRGATNNKTGLTCHITCGRKTGAIQNDV